MIDIIPIVILAIASYRLTRFLVIDTLISNTRNKFHATVINRAQKQGKLKAIWEKLYDLTSCTWCFGFWVSLALYWAYIWTSPVYWGRMDVIAVFAIAGIQGMLHALEPGDE
jgi:hypothetical protein